MNIPILEARDVTKIYPNGVRANHKVNFKVQVGEIHALIGENGAGKSTLMKLLYGMERPTSGAIYLRGEQVHFSNPQAAIRRGIGMVHQNFMLIPSLTVAHNVVLNAEPRRGIALDLKRAITETEQLAKQYGLQVDTRATIASIPVGMRQRVEILKALYRGADIFILDEPTAVLTPNETNDLFAALRTLVLQGKTIIFISHKLKEVLNIADQITVMRGGETLATLPTSEADERSLTRLMVGRDLAELPARQKSTAVGEAQVVLQVKELTLQAPSNKLTLDHLSFEVFAGEILGVAGVEGNGQTQLVEILSGLRLPTSGSIDMVGVPLPLGDVRQIRDLGVAHIPEDRLLNGVALEASIADNLIVDRFYRPPFTRRGLLHPQRITEYAQRLIAQFGVVAVSESAPMNSLSGGNMQKAIVAREFSSAPKLLIAAQPTRGVDVGAQEYIHRQLLAQRERGCAVLLISADLGEVLRLSDRLLVMHNGQITAHFEDVNAVREEEVGLYMLGARRMSW
ncbi:MAG: ABC transporter ATP-binding protein [Anaerolineae bacterium]